MSKRSIPTARLRGVWSATPTPFTEKGDVDQVAVRRLVKHHLRLGVKGLFVCGSCGEGAWMTDGQRRAMLSATAEAADGRLLVAMQVTDNSAGRIIDNMRMARDDGADIAVIAPPYYLRMDTAESLVALYSEAIRACALPVGIYDLGPRGTVIVPPAALKRIYAEKNVIMVKDSSLDPVHMKIALAARRERPRLRLLSGYEFDCVSYLQAGYDGLLLGGGIFNGRLANMIVAAVAKGDTDEAQRLQHRMNRLMWDVYGGRKITCWLAGLKELLVSMGVFRTSRCILRYSLTDTCSKAITRALERDRDVLLP